MAARFVYLMNVSLDLRIERDLDEQGGGNWMRIGEALHREINARAAAMTMFIEGRVIYETMEQFWPTARHEESFPAYIREYGEIWTAMPKVLVSRTRTHAEYDTRVIGGDDAIAQLEALRAEGEGDIGVGGAHLATQLLDARLLDELLLITHPVVLGRGRSLFDTDEGVELDLLEHTAFADGVALDRFAVRDARPAG